MPQVRRSRSSGKCQLLCSGWNPQTRRALEDLMSRGAGKNLPVVFDFDNTLVSGDVGEATLAVLLRDGLISTTDLPATLSPPFRPLGRKLVSTETSRDLTDYYEAFLDPTAHGEKDATPLANAYVWATEVLAGLRIADVVTATAIAGQGADQPHDAFIEATPGGTRFRAPFFHPEMVELLAKLLRLRFDVWVVSASNVWSVRWMVLRILNGLLAQRGVKSGLRADHIIGISTLVSDGKRQLYKDAVLVKENQNYAALDARTLRGLRLTSRLQFPVPIYSGKLACIHDAIGRRPYLCVGDSPGDHAMLAYSEHRLWIARLEKPAFHHKLRELMRRTSEGHWFIQPVLVNRQPGFVPDFGSLPKRLGSLPKAVHASKKILSSIRQPRSQNAQHTPRVHHQPRP